MNTKRGSKSFGWVLVGALILALLPVGAWAQWTHSGNATVGGKLGVGTQTPSRGIHLVGSDAVFRMDRDRYSSAFMLVRTSPGDFSTIWKSFSIGVSASGVNDGLFTISDKDTSAGGTGPTRFTISNEGRVEIGSAANPQASLHIRSPAVGDILRADTTSGSRAFAVDHYGNLVGNGDMIQFYGSILSPNGKGIGNSVFLGNIAAGIAKESFIALATNRAIICNRGERGLLQLWDQDNYWTNYTFFNDEIEITHIGDIAINAPNQGNAQELMLQTTGEEIQFMADIDNDTLQGSVFSWMNNGTAVGDKLMDIDVGGGVRIKSTLTQNHAFDLAEAYWKSEAGIEAGDVVSIDPRQPNAVVLARRASDPAVVGVISTDPGIVMGGGSFSAEHLQELWGDEVADRFAKDRKKIEKELTRHDDYIKGRLAHVSKMKTRRAKGGQKANSAREAAEVAREEQQLADAMEEAALKAFCEENLAQVALAGRVPVKVDASYGAIQIGNLLVASATPGHAMRAADPAPQGTVIGKALEPYASGRGTIMMMVLNR